jgi:serine/threonine protein kinase
MTPGQEENPPPVPPTRVRTPDVNLFVELFTPPPKGSGRDPVPERMPEEVQKAFEDPHNRCGNYVRTECLGQGGMGEVWKAWDLVLGRWVALKFLRFDDAEMKRRFKREALTAAKLSHPNIMSVYGVEESRGRPFIVMQYVRGRTLRALPREDTQLLVELVRDAALAIHAAHGQGVIHRDLKPDNLMVEETPGTSAHGRRLYVMDFGLAKQANVGMSLSTAGSLLGTPCYMSPEQVESRVLDHRADVYSLGATLYDLLVGRPPFQDPNVYNLLLKVVQDAPARPRESRPDLDLGLEAVILKCIDKDPGKRYRTALALSEDLTCWLAGRTVRARARRATAGKRRRRDAGELERRTERVRQHQSTLLELAKADNSDLAVALKRITETDAQTLDVARVSVWFFNDDRTELVCRDLFRADDQAHEQGASLPAKKYPRYFESQETHRVVAAHHAQQDPRTSEFAEDYLKTLGITSMMDVAVRVRGRLVGVVCHEHVGEPREWNLEEQEFASSIADMVALSVEASERRRMEEELARLRASQA